MIKSAFFNALTLASLCCTPAFADAHLTKQAIHTEALRILHGMSLKEKIGQKLMVDFRYWCATPQLANQTCTQDFTSMNPTVKNILSQHHLGGVILFANNLKDIAQITTLNDAFQQTMQASDNLPLLIGTDQEGGIVARLPHDVSVSFPGNIAITAAYLGQPQLSYSAKIGKMIAMDLKAIGININFAPDVDVNVNPLNPVINVRSFSDNQKLVARLGLEMTRAIQAEGVAATLKHFPGHGDTTTDSHVGLPVVSHSLKEAWAIDLFPFKHIIATEMPDLIMTAHIQFPALDNSKIYASKAGEEITTPATLSRKIQFNLLRKQLKYQGVVITDALDMGAIAQNFDATDATIKAFQAGDDIALMPVAISQPDDANKVAELISKIELAVQHGDISLKELDQSVLRILKLKIKLGLFHPSTLPLPEKIIRAEQLFADKSQRELEMSVTNDAVTLMQNNGQLIPIKLQANTRIHILTPWLEQAAGMAVEITRLQAEHKLPDNIAVSFIKMSDTNIEAEKLAIENADIVIVGNSTTKSLPLTNPEQFRATVMISPSSGSLVFPVIPNGDVEISGLTSSTNRNFRISLKNEISDAQFAYQALDYAKNKGKKTIFISLLAPYDLPNYKEVCDAMLAGYNFYGYLSDGGRGYYRGPSMQALTRIIFGITNAKGKLPINVPDPVKPGEIVYARGDGITTGS